MFNRRDETGKLTGLFFLELSTDNGSKFITKVHTHCILSFKEGITCLCGVSIKSAYEMKLMV